MTDRSKPVTMCVCSKVSFLELKVAGVRSLEDAGERFGAGVTCGLCQAYIKKMIQTGETEFAVIEDPSE